MPDRGSIQAQAPIPASVRDRSIISDMAGWSHRLIGEVLRAGDSAIDLTAGAGNDTLALAKFVGADGVVLAFDLQQEAIERTGQLLQCEGIIFAAGSDGSDEIGESEHDRGVGIKLIRDSHANLRQYVTRLPKGVIANLGYLPGGDKEIVTKPESTIAALRSAAELLQPEGRLVVVVYGGHPGGSEEAEAVEGFFNDLSPHEWHVVRLATINRNGAPFVLAAEKKPQKLNI